MADKKEEAVIIKKIKKGGHGGHHGGAWKVAYADFVTAMMAFFLVMWILGLSESSKKAISSYFAEPGAFSFTTGKALPVNISTATPAKYEYNKDAPSNYTEKGGVFENDSQGAEKKQPLDSATKAQIIKALSDSSAAAKALEKKSEELKKQIEEMVKQDEGLRELESNIKVEMTKEGLRIELLETKESLFFEVGSSRMKKEALKLLSALADQLKNLPNSVQIEGHTDSRKFTGKGIYSNWELSSERANSARRVLEEQGLWEGQVGKVVGFADRKLRNPDNPFDVSNRRISILVDHLKTDNFMGAKP